MSKKQIAFTLIELLVVIAIIGILSGLIVVTMNGVTDKANIAKSQVFSNSLRNALMMNLISEWKFDELSTAVQGSSIQDSWSGGNNMILSTGSDGLEKLISSCVSGKCLSFDGSNDYAYVSGSDSASSNLAITGAITLSAWVKFTGTGADMSIVTRGIDGTSTLNSGYAFWRYNVTNKIYFDTYSTTVRDPLSSFKVINDNNWHYVVATWDGTINTDGKKLYIDGELDNKKTSIISAMGQPSYQFKIGASGATSYQYPLNGLVDDVRVYNAAVPSSQIKEYYYAGLNGLLKNGGITKEDYLSRINSVAKQ